MDWEFIFKTYGSAIGPTIAFLLGFFSLYIKLYFDAKAAKKGAVEGLRKLYKIVKESPPPEWIKTYEEPNIILNMKAAGRNAYHRSKFKSRAVIIKSYIDEIYKDIYKNLKSDDAIRLNTIRYWNDLILREIKKHDDNFESINKDKLDFSDKYTRDETLEEKRKLENSMMFTNVEFMMLKVCHQNMMAACEQKKFPPLTEFYNYDLNADESN